MAGHRSLRQQTMGDKTKIVMVIFPEYFLLIKPILSGLLKRSKNENH